MKPNINYDSPKEQRNFGIVICVAVLAIAFVRVLHHRWSEGVWYFPSYWWLVVAAAFLAPAIVYPRVLKPAFWLWMQFAFAINFVVTHVLLTVVFIGMMAPMRLIKGLSGKDPLKRAWEPNAETYWDEPEDQPEEFARYKDQF